MPETVKRPQAPADRPEKPPTEEEPAAPEAPVRPIEHEEALIKEARRLRRRRWLFGSMATALLVGAAAAGYFGVAGPPAPAHRLSGADRVRDRGSLSTRASVPTRSADLIQPTTLATLPNGDLLILDSSRDQILELRPDGDLTVFAGNGRLGFSGDGGPARDAELDFGYFSSAGISVAPNGSVDFLDDGNCRVRQVAPDGVIRTLARIQTVEVSGGPKPTACPADGLAVSPGGAVYVATSSRIDRLTPSGHLVWVAGSNGEEAHEPADATPATVVFAPQSLALNHAGDLYIGSFSPRVVYRLTPAGKLTDLGASYPTAIATEPNGSAIIGTHFGGIQQATATSSRLGLFYNVNPNRVRGINWSTGGFQENGIAATGNGTVYVDNAEGNGYGVATVLVRISPTKRASVAPIRTTLSSSLPKLNGPGFPASLYPSAHLSHGTVRASCPSNSGLVRFTPGAITRAKQIARTYLSSQFAADIAVTDRSWWASDFQDFTNGGDLGTHTVTGEEPASNTPAATSLADSCGPTLIDESIAVTVGASAYSSFTGTLYFLDRDGHPLVYQVR
jgi:hypothetical protein